MQFIEVCASSHPVHPYTFYYTTIKTKWNTIAMIPLLLVEFINILIRNNVYYFHYLSFSLFSRVFSKCGNHSNIDMKKTPLTPCMSASSKSVTLIRSSLSEVVATRTREHRISSIQGAYHLQIK